MGTNCTVHHCTIPDGGGNSCLAIAFYGTQTHIKQFASTESMQLAYCEFYEPTQKQTYQSICKHFVSTAVRVFPKKPKIHSLLHLVECMQQFGPTSGFNTERSVHTSTCTITKLPFSPDVSRLTHTSEVRTSLATNRPPAEI